MVSADVSSLQRGVSHHTYLIFALTLPNSSFSGTERSDDERRVRGGKRKVERMLATHAESLRAASSTMDGPRVYPQ